MADVTYASLQSQIQQSKTQITSQRQTIQQQKIAGERGIQSLRRVHPRTPPSTYFGQVAPQIETVKGRLVELGQAEKQLDISEKKLSEQETLLAEKKAEGWKLREKDGEYEFYKSAPVMRGAVPGEPSGDFTVRVTWMDYRTKPEGETKTVLVASSRLESTRQQISDREGQIIEVESLGGGREYRTPEMRETTGGGFILYEAKPIIKQVITPVPEEKRIGDITVRHLGMDKDIELGFGERPKKDEPVVDAELAMIRQSGISRLGTMREMTKSKIVEYEKFVGVKEQISESFTFDKGDPGKASVKFLASFGLSMPAYFAALPSVISGERSALDVYAAVNINYERAMKRGGVSEVFLQSYLDPMGTGRVFTTTVAASYGIGAGIGALKAAFPLAGTTATVGMVGYGAVAIGAYVAPDVIEKKWDIVGAKAVGIGVMLPFAVVGFGAGMKTGYTFAAKAMEAKGLSPIQFGRTFYTRINPVNIMRNQFVKYKAELIPPEKVFAKSVLEGRKTFAESPSAKESLRQFKLARDPITGEYITVHATSGKFVRSGEILRGTSEHPGLYVTPYGKGSPYFLKTGQPYSSPTEFGLLPKLSRPSVIRLRLDTVFRAPKSVRFNIAKWNKWFMKQLPGRKAVISGAHELGKPEIEAIVRMETLYKTPVSGGLFQRLKGYKFYTKFEGRNIPIRDIKVFDTVPVDTVLHKPVAVGDLAKYDLSSLTKSYHPYVSPYTVGLTSFISSIVSYKPSVAPSYIPSYKPSVAPSYMPSYKPSITPSYAPSFAPSYAPSYVVSYKPSVTPSYVPSVAPSYAPSVAPSYMPSYKPSIAPSYVPSFAPSYMPSYKPSYKPSYVPPPPPPSMPPSGLPSSSYELFGHTMGQGYHTHVKERTHFKGKKIIKKGKMVRLSKRPLSRRDALSLGGMAVDNSAAATFEIRPVNAMAQKPLIKLKSFDMFQDKFYMKDNKYIEKTTHRIDTRGEVKGISARGWYADKTKKAEKKRKVVARRPKDRKEPVDMFDMGMPDMLINMDKVFKGVFDFGF